MSKWEYSETELWRHGEKGVSLLHVFGLTAIGRTILTFAEAREGDASDSACPHSIWMRRSTDGGKCFEPNVCLIPSEKKRCLTNPVPVHDAATGRLFLFYSQSMSDTETRKFLIFSDDAGKRWSQEKDITDLFLTDENPMRFGVAGPGHGIQIQHGPWVGRLVVPYWHRRYGVDTLFSERGYCMSTLYSDDHGVTWRHTGYFGFACLSNESCIAETHDGLLRGVRGGSGDMNRYLCTSRDGGVTWTEPAAAPLPPAPPCHAGLICLDGKQGWENLVLLSRISQGDKRRDMEIWYSRDGGAAFASRLILPPGDAMPGYCDLCVIEEEEPVIGLLHCRSNHVLFSRISLQTLTDGAYEDTKRSVWL